MPALEASCLLFPTKRASIVLPDETEVTNGLINLDKALDELAIATGEACEDLIEVWVSVLQLVIVLAQCLS